MPIPRCKKEDHTRILAALEDHGCVVVDDFFSAETMDRVLDDIGRLREDADPHRPHVNETIGWFFGDKTRHLTALVRHSKTLREEILVDLNLQKCCESILGPNCSGWQLNVAHFLDRGPNAAQQMWHRDHDVWIHLPKTFTVQLASMIALEDFTAENGATRLVPGSHRWENDRQPEPDEIQIAEMSKGAVALYVGGVMHAGGTNNTKAWRPGIHLSYTMGWLRTEENLCLSIPPSEAKDYSDEVLELIGYKYYDSIDEAGGFLGLVDLLDPAELVRDQRLG